MRDRPEALHTAICLRAFLSCSTFCFKAAFAPAARAVSLQAQALLSRWKRRFGRTGGQLEYPQLWDIVDTLNHVRQPDPIAEPHFGLWQYSAGHLAVGVVVHVPEEGLELVDRFGREGDGDDQGLEVAEVGHGSGASRYDVKEALRRRS